MFLRRGKSWAGVLVALALAGGGAGCASGKTSRLDVARPKHWKVTASAWESGHEAKRAVDGNTNTYWRSGTAEPQWIQVDLGRPATVCGFSLQWGEPHATSYSVLTSPDEREWALGYETTSGDGDWDQVSIEPTDAQHLRVVVSKGLQGTGAALHALEIKGLETQPEIQVDGALAPGTAALLDGKPATVWRCSRSEATIQLDLRSVRPVGSVRLDWGPNGFASNVTVVISTNGTNWISAGRIQAQDGIFDVLMNEQVQPVRFMQLEFSGASSADGFEVAGITLRGQEGVAQSWALYELAAEKALDGVYPDALRKRQSFWSLAGGPKRGDAECLLDEWGGFAPRERGPTLAPLIVSGGQVWTARQAAEIEHRLGADVAPMPETTWKMPSGIQLRIRALARSGVRPPMAWVQYELTNRSSLIQTGRLCWVMRPLTLPPPWAGGGTAMVHSCRTSATTASWQEMRVNGLPLFAVPDPGLPFGAAAFENGDVAEYFLRGEVPPLDAAEDETGMVSAAWWLDFALEPGQSTNLVVAANAQASAPGWQRSRSVPWPEVKAESTAMDLFDREWEDASRVWRDGTSGYFPQIARPDAINCLRAQVGWLLGARTLGRAEDADMESIGLRVAALLRAGQPDVAREWIAQVVAGVHSNGWVPAFILPDIQPTPGPGPEGRYAGQGQFAFIVMEYYRFTQDSVFLHQIYPTLTNALGHLQRLQQEQEKAEWRLPDTERFLVEGLLPPTRMRLDRPAVHLYADQYWALLGWKELKNAASILGQAGDAAWAEEQYRTLRSSVRRSLRERMDRMESSWIPASAEEERFDPASVALLFWPCEETDLVELYEVQSSLDAFYEKFLERLQPGWRGTLPADEMQLLIPLASMGRGDYAREVLYTHLDRRRPRGWQAWPAAMGSDFRQPGVAQAMPDAREAASYFIAVRGLAARESGKKLDLFSGAPAEWLQHGEGFHVFGMPTVFGPLDLKGFWQENQFTVEIGGGARPPGGYRLWWPRQIAPERVLANGELFKAFDAQGADLPHDFKGSIVAIFPYSAPWPREP